MPTFNPNNEFFSKTKYFASQARGDFSVALPTNHFLSSVTGALADGKNLLASGLLAKQVTLPSVQLNTYEPTSFIGPTRKHGYGLQFADLSVEFYLMGNTPQEARSLHYFMSRWLEGIAGPRNGTLSDEVGVNSMPLSDSTSFDVRYYNNYIAEGHIKLYAPDSTPIMHIQYSELFPIEISGLQYSWESSDTPVTMSVNFAYYYSRSILS